MATAIGKIERAHEMYREGEYRKALEFYTAALSTAKTIPQKIALHSNRAACYLKLNDFTKVAEECTSVLEFDHQHTGALMLRAQTLVTLKEYQSALFDVSRLMELNPSSDDYRNLQARLRTQLSLAPIPESLEELEEEEEEEEDTKKVGAEKEGKKNEVETTESPMNKESNNVEIIESPYSGAGDDDVANSSDYPKDEPDAAFPQTQIVKDGMEKNDGSGKNDAVVEWKQSENNSASTHFKGWEVIPKPKGHSRLDYSRWDQVEDDSSEDEEVEEEERQPKYRFRVKTAGIRPVK